MTERMRLDLLVWQRGLVLPLLPLCLAAPAAAYPLPADPLQHWCTQLRSAASTSAAEHQLL